MYTRGKIQRALKRVARGGSNQFSDAEKPPGVNGSSKIPATKMPQGGGGGGSLPHARERRRETRDETGAAITNSSS